jgi:glyoxylase-like metal-dependent hydrolase (beta-lactamase superfamily II)
MTSKKARVRSDQRSGSSEKSSARRRSRNSSSARATRARIRVYRHGLGDCILVRLRRRNGTDYKILIDCGVAVAQGGAAKKMTEVVEDVVRETGGKIDVLAVTHEHWDHVS